MDSESKTKNLGGRPPKTLTPEEIKQLEKLSAYLSAEQIADYFGIGRTTFYKLMDTVPEVYEHYQRGKAKAIHKVAQGLVQQALDGNTGAAIFYLKTQARWKETSVQEVTGADGGPVQVQGIELSFVKPNS